MQANTPRNRARRAQVKTIGFPPGLLYALGGIAALLLAIGATFFFAPEKPPAPPGSVISQESRPKPKPRNPEDIGREYTPPPNPLVRVVQNPNTPAQGALTPEKKEPKPFAITGQVLEAATKKPVAGVQLRVTRVWSEAEQADWNRRNSEAIASQDPAAIQALTREAQNMQVTYTAKSEENGNYRIEIKEPGRYSLYAFKNGFLPVEREAGTVSEEQPELTVDITLSNGASVAGRVTEGNTTVGAADVVVWVDENREYRAVTDEDGNYVLSGLPPGEYGITINVDRTPYRVGKAIPYRRIRINDPQERITGVNFSVEVAGVVWGVVKNVHGDVVPGAEVILIGRDSVIKQAITSALENARVVSDRSRDDGYYELLGVPLNSEWQIYASTDAYAPQLSDPFMLTESARSVRVDLFLYDGSTVQGRVVDSKKGNPVPGAAIRCVPSLTKLVKPLEEPGAFRTATSDENGYFTLPQLSAGIYQVFAQKDGYKFSLTGTEFYADGLNSINDLVVKLEPVASGEHSVWGVVVDAAGVPLAGADVVLEGMSRESLGAVRQQTNTDGDGRFRFDNLEQNTYRLRVSHEGYATRALSRVRVDQETRVVMSSSAVVRGVVLVKETGRAPEGGYKVGAYPLSESGRGAINLARLNQVQAPAQFYASDGSFQLMLEPGLYRLQAEGIQAERYAAGRVEVSVVEGQVVDGVTIFLSDGGAEISGRVVVSDGSSPAGAQAFLIDFGSGDVVVPTITQGNPLNIRNVRIGDDGLFRFDKLAAGTYNVVVQHPSYAAGQSGPVELGDGDKRAGITIRLGKGGAIEGKIMQNKRPVSGAIVLVINTETGTNKNTTSDQNGYYFVDGLATGVYEMTVTVLRSGQPTDLYNTMGAQVQVEEGKVTRKDFSDSEGTRLIGICTPPPSGIVGGMAVLRYPTMSAPAPGEIISAAQLPDLDHIEFRIIGPDGGFIFEGLQDDSYIVDLYYPEGASPGSVQLVHSEPVIIEGQGQLRIPIRVNIVREQE